MEKTVAAQQRFIVYIHVQSYTLLLGVYSAQRRQEGAEGASASWGDGTAPTHAQASVAWSRSARTA